MIPGAPDNGRRLGESSSSSPNTIDDHLLAEVRRRAAELGKTVSQVIEDSVRHELSRRGDDERAPFRITAFHGGSARRGVDLDDNAALLAAMDDPR